MFRQVKFLLAFTLKAQNKHSASSSLALISFVIMNSCSLISEACTKKNRKTANVSTVSEFSEVMEKCIKQNLLTSLETYTTANKTLDNKKPLHVVYHLWIYSDIQITRVEVMRLQQIPSPIK